MNRHTRYQGAIVKDHCILLLKQRIFPSGRIIWLFPGGGLDSGETEEECVQREMKEETNLDVRVVSLLIDEPGNPGDVYRQLKTYLCEPVGGEASPGYDPEYDPEIEAAGLHGIPEIKWFDLRSEED